MIEYLLTILLLGIASYRLTRFFVLDTLIGMGTEETLDPDTQRLVLVPNSKWGEVVFRFAYVSDEADEHYGEDRSFIRGKIGDLLGCIFCLGFWISTAAFALWTWSLPWTVENPQQWILSAFAVAGVQTFLNTRQDA